MQKKIYLTGIEKTPGKSFVAMGLVSALLKLYPKLQCRKLFSENDNCQFRVLSNLSQQPVTPLMSINDAMSLMHGNPEDLLATILESLPTDSNAIPDFFEGSDFQSDNSVFEYQFNLSLAYQLNCDVILVISAHERSLEQTASLLKTALTVSKQQHARVTGIIINRVPMIQVNDAVELFQKTFGSALLVTILPEFETLAKPSVNDILRILQAKVIYGEQELHRLVSQYTVAAKTVDNFLQSRVDRNGMLIITPYDRVDILLGSLLADQSANYPKIAGIVLTGGEMPHTVIQDIIAGLEHPFPVLLTNFKTYETATRLFSAKFSIADTDTDKIASAIAAMTPWLTETASTILAQTPANPFFSPATFLYGLNMKAKALKKHIVLPEGYDPRILEAADYILQRQIADITLLGKREKIAVLAKRLGLTLPKVSIIDLEATEKAATYAELYFQLRKHKNVNLSIARERMTDGNFFAAMMVYCNDADGMVSGAIHTTADTVRPALEIIKTKPGAGKVSSIFIMCLTSKVLIYGDCAINPEPDSPMLAEIANQAAGIAKQLGLSPRVALLSYSSGTSGKGESVEKVARALTIIKETKPDFLVEGPIQYDAAVDPEIARAKLPDSQLAGDANVLIFPDLNTGNNTYKAVQRETGALAIGPVLLGLNKPVNDLSRGCTAQDIINTILVTAIQAQGES